MHVRLHSISRFGAAPNRRAMVTGVTLVELLIAMTISLVIVIAASGVYLLSGQAFTTVDSASQLQDSERFATYILRRMVQQAGYEDFSEFATDLGRSQSGAAGGGDPTCVQADLCGFQNRVMPVSEIIFSGGTGTTGTLSAGPYYTDTLVAQFQGQSTFNTALSPPAPTATADGTIIDCSGNPIPSNLVAPPTRAMSALYVEINSITGEPELNCASRDPSDGSGRPRWPLVKGVEVFKVMYEVGNDLTDSAGNNVPDGVADKFQWVRADQVATLPITKPAKSTVSDAVNAWQNVVAVRFGLVLRGNLGTATPPSAAVTLYPLGQDLAVSGDPATNYVPPIDSRLRRVVTFTVHLRNRGSAFYRE